MSVITDTAPDIKNQAIAANNGPDNAVNESDSSTLLVEKFEQNKADLHQKPSDTPDIEVLKNENSLPDKQINKNTSLLKIWKMLDSLASNSTIVANVIGGFMHLMDLPDKAKERIAKVVDLVTNFSFIPYGLDGMRKGIFENKNPYMSLGFFMELTMVWMSDLKDKYLIRGAATGTDQIWVATQDTLEERDPVRFDDGKFQTWRDGLIETPKTCWQMLKNIFKDPSVLWTIDKEKGTKGYLALLSSIGSFGSTVGYFLTRNEKVFGTMRDISASLFDFEMVLKKDLTSKLSGACFIGESVLDFAAKFIGDNNTRLFVNMLSHAFGRSALQLYKASNQDKSDSLKNLSGQVNSGQRLNLANDKIKGLSAQFNAPAVAA